MVLLIPTSCWDHKEVEQLGIVLATELAMAPNGDIRATVQILNPKELAGGGAKGMGGGGSGGGGATAYRNASGEGKTIFDAVRAMNTAVPKELYFSHNQVIIISEELARQNITDLLDFFDRNPQIRRSNWLLISKKDVCQYDLMSIPSPLVIAPSQRIVSIINERDRSSVYAINQLGDFLELLANEGVEAYTAGVGFHSEPAKSEVGGEESPKQEIHIDKTAIFRAGKMVGWLNNQESRGLLWATEGLKNAIYSVSIEDNKVALEILQSSTKSTPIITEDGQITLQIDIKARASIAETVKYMDLTNPATIQKLRIMLQNAIKRDIHLALEKTQQYKSDVLGVGVAIYRKYPEYWREIGPNWIDYYGQVQLAVNVEVIIPRTGLVSKPIKAAGEGR